MHDYWSKAQYDLLCDMIEQEEDEEGFEEPGTIDTLLQEQVIDMTDLEVQTEESDDEQEEVDSGENDIKQEEVISDESDRYEDDEDDEDGENVDPSKHVLKHCWWQFNQLQ